MGTLTDSNSTRQKHNSLFSGASRIDSPTISLNGSVISQQDSLSHLGFYWNHHHRRNILSLHHHKERKISDLWATTASLISAGVKNCHPDSIVCIFNTILLPRLLYRLELTPLTKTQEDKLDTQARSCV